MAIGASLSPEEQAARIQATRDMTAEEQHGMDQDRFQASAEAFPAQQEAYTSARHAAEMNRPFAVTMGPGEAPVTFDPATQRYSARTAAADDFLNSLHGVALDDRGKNAAGRAHAAILAGADPQKVMRSFDEEVKLGVKAGYGSELQGQKDEAAMARVKAKPLSIFQAGQLDVARNSLGLRAEEAGNREFQQFLTSQGYKADVGTMKDLVDTNRSLAVGNSALDVTAGAQFAKKAQGAGVLTDKDYDRFWSAIGGGEARPADWFDMAVSGEMGEEKRRIVVEGIRHKVSFEENRLKNVAVQADKKFGNEPWYKGTRMAYFDFLPGLPAQGAAAGPRIGTSGMPTRGGPPEVRRPAKRVTGEPDAVEKLLKAAEGYLR
jgi:hypothetical protein